MDQSSDRRQHTAAVALRARRAALGLTLKRAAPHLGIAEATLSLAESGHWRVSDARLAELMAAYDRLELGS